MFRMQEIGFKKVLERLSPQKKLLPLSVRQWTSF